MKEHFNFVAAGTLEVASMIVLSAAAGAVVQRAVEVITDYQPASLLAGALTFAWVANKVTENPVKEDTPTQGNRH